MESVRIDGSGVWVYYLSVQEVDVGVLVANASSVGRDSRYMTGGNDSQ